MTLTNGRAQCGGGVVVVEKMSDAAERAECRATFVRDRVFVLTVCVAAAGKQACLFLFDVAVSNAVRFDGECRRQLAC